MAAAKKRRKDIETDLLIIGGGLAGLTAAVGLRHSGLRMTIVEQEPILGGRARSWTDEKTGDPVHIGPHIFVSQYPNMRRLLEILGTADKIIWQREKRFILVVDGQREIVMGMADLPPPLQWVPALVADDSYRPRDLLANLRTTLVAMQLTEADVMRLDHINALAFLRQMGNTERFIQRFWAFSCMSILNVPLEVCSAGALMRFYARLIGHRNYEVGFPDGGLGDTFAPAAKEMIEEAGGTFMLNTTVKQILANGGAATGAELTDGRMIRARYTLATVPPQVLRAILPLAWLRQHQCFADLVHFQPCPYISTFLWFDRKLTDKQFWARTHDNNDLNCDFYDLSNINRGWADRNSVITTNCIYSHRAHHLSDEEMVAETIRELAEYLPEAAEAKLEHYVVNRIPMAIHCPSPGTESKRPTNTTPVQDLYLAGDWIKTGLPSSMESACKAGWQVAEELLDVIGQRESLVIDHQHTEGIAGLINRIGRLSPIRLGGGP